MACTERLARKDKRNSHLFVFCFSFTLVLENVFFLLAQLSVKHWIINIIVNTEWFEMYLGMIFFSWKKWAKLNELVIKSGDGLQEH